jgi:hypothetical protein
MSDGLLLPCELAEMCSTADLSSELLLPLGVSCCWCVYGWVCCFCCFLPLFCTPAGFWQNSRITPLHDRFHHRRRCICCIYLDFCGGKRAWSDLFSVLTGLGRDHTAILDRCSFSTHILHLVTDQPKFVLFLRSEDARRSPGQQQQQKQ